MATITGQKLTELNTLLIGGTGSKIYVVSQAGASYQMSFSGLTQSLTGIYFNNIYQPKVEDWRFVHKTGVESITGIKTFVDNIKVNGIQSSPLTAFIDVANGELTNGSLGIKLNWLDSVLYDNSASESMSWNNRILYGENVIPTLNWSGRILSGSWTAEQLESPKLIIGGIAPPTPTSAGTIGQLALSGSRLYIATGSSKWGYIPITAW